MRKKVTVVEVVLDDELRERTPAATEAFRRLFPDAPELTLYRTGDGRLGLQIQLAPAAPATAHDSRRRIGP